jgi:anti-sigma factor RsiW
MDTDDQRITSYLVGELPEAEQAELERQYFDDATLVDRVIQVETQLLDAYARGQLSEQMRQRVARQYLAHPARRERLRFAETLAAKLDDFDLEVLQGREGRKSQWPAWTWWSGRAAQFSMAAATLLLMITAGWLYLERIRLREELARVQTAREQRDRELQQLPTERPNNAAGRSSPAVVSLVFAIGSVRGLDDLPPTLKIPAGTEQVRLELNLKENDYAQYGIALHAVGGTEILNRQGLQPNRTASGWRLELPLPADRVAPGDYMLTLSGTTRDGARDEVSKSLFRVER